MEESGSGVLCTAPIRPSTLLLKMVRLFCHRLNFVVIFGNHDKTFNNSPFLLKDSVKRLSTSNLQHQSWCHDHDLVFALRKVTYLRVTTDENSRRDQRRNHKVCFGFWNSILSAQDRISLENVPEEIKKIRSGFVCVYPPTFCDCEGEIERVILWSPAELLTSHFYQVRVKSSVKRFC